MEWPKKLVSDRKKSIELFAEYGIISISYVYDNRAVILKRLGEYTDFAGHKNYKIIEYFNKEKIIENSELDIGSALNEMDRYGFYRNSYKGRIFLNNHDINLVPFEENGVLITTEEIFKLLEMDKHLGFSFKKNDTIIYNNIHYVGNMKTKKIELDAGRPTLTVCSSDYEVTISDEIFDTIEDMIKGLEKLDVIVDGKAYMYAIHGINPEYFLDKIRNKQ